MSLESAFAPAEQSYRAAVLEDTWGHLAPKKNVTYRGHLIIAFPEYESGHLNPVIIQDNVGLEGSPWWYQAVHEFLRDAFPNGGESGDVIRMEVTFRNYRFWAGAKRTLVKARS
jgi:hypothetical protein